MYLADNCRRSGTRWRLGNVLAEVLQNNLPEDAHV